MDVRTGDPALAAWAGRDASPDAGGSAPRDGKGKRGPRATRVTANAGGPAADDGGAGARLDRPKARDRPRRFGGAAVAGALVAATDNVRTDDERTGGVAARVWARDEAARLGHRSLNEFSGAVVSTFAPGASAIWMWEQLVEDTELRRGGHPVSSLGRRRGKRFGPAVMATNIR